ncbi:MAG: ribbon-helix-helix protein, CopG family [Clostridiales bacterium]|nr:ribbon-helix-helix protein, CopG family [Clostridiales bacterium]
MEERTNVNITITMTKEERTALKVLAAHKDMSVSALIREWLAEKLKDNK